MINQEDQTLIINGIMVKHWEMDINTEKYDVTTLTDNCKVYRDGPTIINLNIDNKESALSNYSEVICKKCGALKKIGLKCNYCGC